MKLKPKNWAKYQHYKNRLPPWIKLHHDILRDIDFMCLPIASKAIAPLLWLLASESKSGEFDADINVLMFRLHMTEKDIQSGLKPLIDKGFFVVASGVLADCEQLATTETETETETEVKKKSISPKGSRLIIDSLPGDWFSFCKNERPDLNPTEVFAGFKDYWISVPGQKGSKADWFATWRNWVRNQKQSITKPRVDDFYSKLSTRGVQA